jgi:multidrug transporter EmrE-like cation transporter
MSSLNYLLILFSVVVIGVGQVLFKLAARNLRAGPSQGYLGLLHDNAAPLLMIAVALLLYLISTVAWLKALRVVPLSVAYMFNSLAFVLVPLAGFILFSEPVPRFFLIGLALIVGGILVISMP